jgi:hypothetical protein
MREAAADDGIGRLRPVGGGGGRRGEEGEGGGGAMRWSVCFVFYLALSYEASKNLETFQETSSRLPGTPLPVVT